MSLTSQDKDNEGVTILTQEEFNKAQKSVNSYQTDSQQSKKECKDKLKKFNRRRANLLKKTLIVVDSDNESDKLVIDNNYKGLD